MVIISLPDCPLSEMLMHVVELVRDGKKCCGNLSFGSPLEMILTHGVKIL
jgi:hypothetical protein